MNYSIIIYILGWIMNVEAVCMLVPGITALIYREKSGIAFLITILACLAIGVPLVSRKPSKKAFYAREGLVTTALSWIVLSIVGAVPFVLSGAIPDPIDAFFEIVSGFTTTGSSILSDPTQMSYCINIWRCFSHWIGGMGVLVCSPDTAAPGRWLSYEPYEGRKPRLLRRKASSKSPVNCQDPVQDLHCTHCCTDHPPASWGDASLRQSLCSIWNCRNRWVRNQIRQYGKLQLIYSDRHHYLYDPVWR